MEYLWVTLFVFTCSCIIVLCLLQFLHIEAIYVLKKICMKIWGANVTKTITFSSDAMPTNISSGVMSTNMSCIINDIMKQCSISV